MPKQEKIESPLLRVQTSQDKKKPNYSNDEETYLSNFQSRLESARDERDQPHDEFDGMDYLTFHESNEKEANTFIKPKANKTDTSYQSGTVRQKLFAFLAALNKMNLTPSPMAFDDTDTILEEMGIAVSDIMRKTEELDNDEEKKLMRQFELLKQGTVFIEETWKKKYKTRKSLEGEFKGQINDVKWQDKLEEYISQPSRDILYGPGVYLGDIHTYSVDEQPFIYTVDIKPWEEAKSVFGKWERWDFVTRDLKPVDPNNQRSIYNNNWRLSGKTAGEDQVEIIRYQDKWNDEFQIICNGVMMLPIGFPLSAISPNGEYTIAKQVWEMIHSKFAYGNSLVRRMKPQVSVYDEMIRMAILKTQQSYAPPMVNNTGRVLSNKIFFPGKMLHGVDPEKIKPLLDANNGVNQSEMAMLQLIQETMDSNSVNKTFQGQKEGGDPTATQILQVQEQSSMIIGLTVFTAGLLEKKLGELRLWNILEHWFEPIGTKLDAARELINQYRTANVEATIPGRGMGRSKVVVSDSPVPPEQVKEQEETESDKLGIPVRIMYLMPQVIKAAKITWQMVVSPTEKRSSNSKKLMFRAMTSDLLAIFPQDTNYEYLQERFAESWEEDKNKLFRKQVQEQPINPNQGQPNSEGDGSVPTVNPITRQTKIE